MDESQKHAALEKLTQQLEETFVDSVRSSNVESLKDMVINLSKEMEEVAEAKKADAKITALKEDLKVLSGGYSDLIKDKKKRIQLVLLVLENRGKL